MAHPDPSTVSFLCKRVMNVNSAPYPDYRTYSVVTYHSLSTRSDKAIASSPGNLVGHISLGWLTEAQRYVKRYHNATAGRSALCLVFSVDMPKNSDVSARPDWTRTRGNILDALNCLMI